MPEIPPIRRRGLVLVIVVGVLGILVVLGSAFVMMARLERKASQQRVNATRATLLARSGLEDGLARLEAGQDPETASSRYRGENWDGSSDGLLSPGEAAQETYRRTGAGTPADEDACPVQQAMRPSFFTFTTDGLANPLLASVDGRLRGISGRLSDGHYALQVASGGLWVNGGDPEAPATPPPAAPPGTQPTMASYNVTLRRILGTLAEALDRQTGGNDGQPVDETDGWRLLDARPASGWQGWTQLRDLALGGSQAKLDALKPYLALHAWTDKKVIQPNPNPGTENFGYSSWGDIKMRHLRTQWVFGMPDLTQPDFERIPPVPPAWRNSPWDGKVVGRAPVDLAWARTRRPVLIALLAGLKGLYLDNQGWPGGTRTSPHVLGRTPSALIDLPATWTPTCDCLKAADQILASTSDLGTWAAWDAFCDTLAFSGTNDQAQAKRDILKANFNPNSDLNKFNPNPSLWRMVDKSDLIAYSTEFSLMPVSDRRLACTGRVLGPDGKLLAARTLEAELSGPSVFRLSTQKEFSCEDLGRLDLAGDEKDLRVPGFRRAGAPEFLSQSQGMGRTWGHRLDLSDQYPGTWMAGDSRGASLQTYPEPCVDFRTYGEPVQVNAADYDGNLQRATMETPQDAWYGVAAPAPTLGFLTRYTAGLDLDTAGGPYGRECIPDVKQAVGYDLHNGLFSGGTLPPLPTSYPASTLYPDGCYAEFLRIPAYYDLGCANGLHGHISLWFKPSWKPVGFVPHSFLRWTSFWEWQYSAGINQFFFLGAYGPMPNGVNSGLPGASCFIAHFETGHDTGDVGHEHQFLTPKMNLQTHRWSLLTCYYDFQGLDGRACGRLLLNDGASPDDIADLDLYPTSSGANDPTSASDITEDQFGWPHQLQSGWRNDMGREDDDSVFAGAPKWGMSVPDATLDEFALYDFGATRDNTDVLAGARFAEGRYYKGAAYTALGAAGNTAPEFFSAPILLPNGSSLRKVAWTWQRPTALPDDYAEIELTDPSGAAYLGPLTRSTKGPRFSPDRQVWEVARTVDAPFRAHVVFRRVEGSPTVDDNIPLLDSPVLDDLTFFYEPKEGPKVLSWRGGD